MHLNEVICVKHTQPSAGGESRSVSGAITPPSQHSRDVCIWKQSESWCRRANGGRATWGRPSFRAVGL